MGNALKILVVLGGVAYLLRDQIQYFFAGPASPASPGTSAPTPAQPAPASSVAPDPMAEVWRQMAAAATTDTFFTNGAGNYDHWSFYYKLYSGQDAPPFEAMFAAGTPRAGTMLLDTYKIGLRQAGVLGGLDPVRAAWGYR